MKIEFEDRVWQIDLMDIDMVQGETIGAYTGLSVMAWYKSLLDTDSLTWLKSVRCLYWLIRAQNDDPADLETVNFAPLQLFAAFSAARVAETQPGAAEADPTNSAASSAAAAPPAADRKSVV